MQFHFESVLSRFIGRRDGRRVPGRVRQHGVRSTLGPVLDLSEGGMRVLSIRPRTGVFIAEIRGYRSRVVVEAMVVWTRRLGFFRHEVGLAFVDLDDHVRKKVNQIAVMHAEERAIA